MITLADKAHAFRDLHRRPGTFVMPNPWDVGSARLLARMGFEALATTSAGLAFSNGRRDGTGTLDETIAHVARLAAATDLPLSADLERGFGDAPRDVARAIRLAAAAGAVGGSIEDATGQTGTPLYDVEFAADRVRAAAEAARDLPHPFTLTARAENFLVGRPDLRDTIARLQAYQAAGADVLFAPGLTTGDEIATVVASVDRPVNIVMGLQGARLDRGGVVVSRRTDASASAARWPGPRSAPSCALRKRSINTDASISRARRSPFARSTISFRQWKSDPRPQPAGDPP